MSDPVREYGKYKTARRNVNFRYSERIGLLEIARRAKLKELDDALSPAAKRIRDAAETVDTELCASTATSLDGSGVLDDETRVTLGSGVEELTIPARLLEEPTPLPPGSLIEGRENGKRQRA
jgi:hypothetical protein